MASPNSWMPLYGDDFQADTGHCTATQRGAYTDLIWACWKRGNSLPDDDDQLMRLARCTPKEWGLCRKQVLAFFTRDGDVWRHKRVGKELARATARYEAKAQAGRKGSQKRWHTDSTANGTAITEPITNECTTHNSHSLEREPVAKATGQNSRGSRILPDWKPSGQDLSYAADQGLNPETITAVGEQFKDHWLAKSGAGAVKRDWAATWRTWVKNHIGYHGSGAWPANGGKQARANGQGAGSVVDVVSRLKARAAMVDENEQSELGRGDNRVLAPVGMSVPERGGNRAGAEVIDANDADGMYRTFRRD